jgi:hypothetical protein
MTMAPTDSPEGLRPPGGRPRDEDRRTRKPLPFWDRIKFLLLLTVFWFILLWSTKSGNPLVTWSDAFRIEVRSGAWVRRAGHAPALFPRGRGVLGADR